MTDNNGSGTKSVIKKYDDQEDLEIKRAAFERDNIFAKYIFCVEIILFGILFWSAIPSESSFKYVGSKIILSSLFFSTSIE